MNNSRVSQLGSDITTVLQRPIYNPVNYGSGGVVPGGAKEQLLRSLAPNCTQLIVQCAVGRQVFSGLDCCNRIFDPNPYFTQAGTQNSILSNYLVCVSVCFT